MKKLLLALLLVISLCSVASAEYTYTDPALSDENLDYYDDTPDAIVETVDGIYIDGDVSASGTIDADGTIMEGYIKGLSMLTKDGNEVTFTPGIADVNGTMEEVTTNTNVGCSVGSGDDMHYFYLDSNASISSSLTEPTYSNTLHGLYNGTDRCIGAAWENDSNVLEDFFNYTNGSEFQYIATDGTYAQVVTDGEPNGGKISLLTSSSYVAVNSKKTWCWLYAQDANTGCGGGIIADEATVTQPGKTGFAGLRNQGYDTLELCGFVQLGDSRNIAWFGQDNDDNATDVGIGGFLMER